jgi:hypothetical protein
LALSSPTDFVGYRIQALVRFGYSAVEGLSCKHLGCGAGFPSMFSPLSRLL